MHEVILPFSAATVAGFLAGIFFFGGLHWTLRRYLNSPKGWLMITASLFLRMSITMTAFYFVGRGDWRLMIACLVGFMIARSATLRITQIPSARAT